MAVQTTYNDGTLIAAASGGNHAGSPCRTVITGVYDATRLNVVSGDSIPVINIPAGTIVENVVLEVVTGQATVTFAIGLTGGTTDGYLAATTVATAGTKTAGTTGTYIADGVGDLYATADQLDLLVGAATASTCVIKVHAICTIV